jgi:hypothetical protein
MMEATVAIGTKCKGVRDLVGTSIGQHLHVMHFEEWRAVVGEKRRLIDAGFAVPLGIGQNPRSDPRITLEGRLSRSGCECQIEIFQRRVAHHSGELSVFASMAVTRVEKAGAS